MPSRAGAEPTRPPSGLPMMQLFKDASLLRQLLGWIVLPLVPLVAINAWLSSQHARESANQAFDRTLQASVRSIADRISVENGELAVDIPVAALEMFDPHFQDRVFYRIGFVGGSTITGNIDFPLPPRRPAARETLFYDASYQGEAVRAAAYVFPLYYAGANRLMLVQAGETTLSRQALASRLQRATVQQQILLTAVVMLFASIGVRRVLRPLHRVGQTLTSRTGDPTLQLDEQAVQRELKPLVRALNGALAQLEQQLAIRQRFIADAAHQLRTPLTLLKMQAEMTLRQDDPAARHAGLTALVAATNQTIRLANQLLTLSRAEPGVAQHEPQRPLDLAALARDIAREFVTPALAKALDIGYEGADSAMIVGQPVLLRELLSNLVDNAVRYTPAGGMVTVAVRQTGQQVELSVCDSGPGIPAAERQRVFERFYRGESAGGDGCGLGLAIVEEIARTHRADIALEDVAGGGLRVRVGFPGGT